MYAVEVNGVVEVVTPYNKDFVLTMHELNGRFKSKGSDKWWEILPSQRKEMEKAIDACYAAREKDDYVYVVVQFEERLINLYQDITSTLEEVRTLTKPLNSTRLQRYGNPGLELRNYDRCLNLWKRLIIAQNRKVKFANESFEFSVAKYSKEIENCEEGYAFRISMLQQYNDDLKNKKQKVLDYIEKESAK